MKNLYYLLTPILVAAVAFSGVTSLAESQVSFFIKDAKIRFYDNQNDTLVEKRTNPYGNGMNVFLSVLISQKVESPNDNSITSSSSTYNITVEGYGKGRENQAEGLVEDYKIKETKEVTIYHTQSQYVPFVLEYPCTEKTSYTITVVQKGTDNRATKTIQVPPGSCYLN